MIEKLIIMALEKGWDAIEQGSDAKRLRIAIRARLARELRFNLELMKAFDSETSPSLFTENFSTAALNEICTLTVPLSVFFDESSRSPLLNGYLEGESTESSKYSNWSRDIQSELQLVERIWHRMRILEVRRANGLPLGDLGYLRHLMQALLQSLK